MPAVKIAGKSVQLIRKNELADCGLPNVASRMDREIMSAPGKVGFIGGGNMGEALIKGLLGSGGLTAAHILVGDISQERLQHLQATYQVLPIQSNLELVTAVEVIVLAVKPQQVDGVLAEIRTGLAHSPLLISIAAGVPLARLQAGVARQLPIIRVMPNTPALVLAGASAMAAGPQATAEHMSICRDLFETVGSVVDVAEKEMDAVTGLSGSGPAYVLLVLEALIDAGVFMGLARPVARDLVVQTALGAAKLLAESEAHPAALKDHITSPAGTAIRGLAVLERGGIRGMLMDAVAAATRRSTELGRKAEPDTT
jgi:pyrroline-5-carboxylate reductase